MKRLGMVGLTALLAAATGLSHFVYLVPAKDSKSLAVVFSDDLEIDDNVTLEKIAGLKLTGRFADGSTKALEMKSTKTSLTATWSQPDLLLASGKVVYGISKTSPTKPTLLVYHPKVVMGGVTGEKATVGESTEFEIVPLTKDGVTTYQLFASGKPVADSEGSLLKPDGTKEKLKTDKDGKTAAIKGTGRYALWLRVAVAKPSEHAGTKYDEVKNYATLVVDVK